MNEIGRCRVLLVDDDARLRELLTRFLHTQGFPVKAVADGAAMERALEREHFDMVILDLMLPGEDGLTLLRRLRQREAPLGVIMLTAKGDEEDRIRGLELGADDYLPKPFNPRELVARIHAVMRRRPREPLGAPAPQGGTVVFGDNVLDLTTRRLTRHGEEIPLTTGEFAVLRVLAEHPNQPMTRDKLMELARGREHGPFDRAIDVQISRLRRLVEPDPGKPRYIQTVWGVGYVFVPDAPAEEPESSP
ncbi:MAG: two-component system response regulator OmpR [Tepidiphilus sp.]|jgi:two-component system phosphate regulon response regulator OmpR|uniref:Two-component system response regulator OmpR n=1 Tax=Tepidiphilus baoligensis TaxID=2698687 RepID=A0ABX1QPH6_9PROT|nr:MULTISPECIES: two-component system response regulator OmpR [Tepidiphilus]MDD2407961.1 two-component system response regulator OmpR [Tepidiphilus sp.]MDD3433131.1 two-component system response regulator OmpR [Tepidiphilus sp.]NMH17224.1 two-component system response regulator OmpR [Tepidiphilus baoligensis]